MYILIISCILILEMVKNEKKMHLRIKKLVTRCIIMYLPL